MVIVNRVVVCSRWRVLLLCCAVYTVHRARQPLLESMMSAAGGRLNAIYVHDHCASEVK